MATNSKSLFFTGIVLGFLGGYAWSLKRTVALQNQLLEASTPPREFTRKDWWENNRPATADEHQLVTAKRDWVRYFFHNFIYPYIDQNAASMLSSEFLMPLNDRLVEIEMEQRQQEQLTTLRQIQRAGQTDD